jgi:hypothetical protein
MSSSCHKKISVQTNEVSNFVWEKLLVIFGPCNPNISQKEASGNFESRTTFALLIKIYLVWEFHTFSSSRSWETPKRGPLKWFCLFLMRIVLSIKLYIYTYIYINCYLKWLFDKSLWYTQFEKTIENRFSCNPKLFMIDFM